MIRTFQWKLHCYFIEGELVDMKIIRFDEKTTILRFCLDDY